jgi:L-xylulokinase
VGRYILGLDIGGTVVKATACDPQAGVAHTRGRPVPVMHPAPGHNERDAMTIWHETAAVVHEVIDLLPPRSTIDAVGITGHGNGLYLVDGRGRPVRPAIMASDTRAARLVRDWNLAGVEARLAPLTWNRLWPGQPGPILAWLLEHEPGTLEDASAALMCKDFIRAQLVGRIGTELTDQSCSGLYENATDGPCEAAIDALGIRELERLFAPPARSTDVAGEVTVAAAELTGIPVGTPVVAGVVDNVALHLGSRVLDGSRICVAAGTWSVNQLLVARDEMVPSRRLGDVAPLAACLAAEEGTALLIDASPTSAGTLAWAVDHALGGIRQQAEASGTDVFELALRRVATVTPKPDDPVFVPYLDGSRDSPSARGAWLNLSSWNDEDSLLAAIVEGVCMEHRRHVERLSPDPERLPLRLSGGAAKSATWAQRFADVTGRQVEVSASQEVGAVGAAAVAGVGIGTFADLGAGAAALNAVRATFTPDDALVAHYDTRYRRYRETSDWIASLAG